MKRLAFLALTLVAACAGGTERPYRLPYGAGTEVTITADHTDHQRPREKMFDMRARQSGAVITAAAPGWVREIEDSKDSTSPTNNYVWIEHPLDYCQPVGGLTTQPNPPANCRTCPKGLGKCNEWTLYAHFQQGSVGQRVSPNQWVEEGQPIGLEGDVGCQQFSPPCTRHLHFTVFTIDRDATSAQNLPDVNGAYEFYAQTQEMFGDGRPERVPLFCTSAGLRLVRTGETHMPGACPPLVTQ